MTSRRPHVWGALVGLAAAAVALWTPAPGWVLPITGLLGIWVCGRLSGQPGASGEAALCTIAAPAAKAEATAEPAPSSAPTLGIKTAPASTPNGLPGPRDLRIWPPRTYVEDTGTVKGRGVYAAKHYLAGELVEAAPVTVFAMDPNGRLPMELKLLIFRWPTGSFGGFVHALAHGYVSLFNHDSPSNCRYELDLLRSEIHIYTLREVAPGEELTVNYNCGYSGRDEDGTGDWFAANGIVPAQTPLRLPSPN